MRSNGTPVYTRQHRRGPTLPQLSAIDLLVGGKNDKETAGLLGLSRTAVTKWRLYDPVFQAALNLRRAEVWGAGIDRLRSLIPKALDALAEEVEDKENPNRLKAAVEVLRIAQLSAGGLAQGPTDPDEIVRKIVEQRHRQAHGPLDDFLDSDKNLPSFERHIEEVRKELEELANEPDEAGPSGREV